MTDQQFPPAAAIDHLKFLVLQLRDALQDAAPYVPDGREMGKVNAALHAAETSPVMKAVAESAQLFALLNRPPSDAAFCWQLAWEDSHRN